MSRPKTITIVTPCYNEEANIVELYAALKELFDSGGPLSAYNFEQIAIDNASTDKTPELLKELAGKDKRFKVILNNRNFGHIRSPYHGILQAKGDAVIFMASDFQDPPNLLKDFVAEWEKGWKVVLGVKKESEETAVMFAIRKAYYRLVNRISDIDLVKDYTGFGLYDQQVIEVLRSIPDTYPYFRGLIADLGYPSKKLYFRQPQRKRGVSANNFYTLYDIAMLGITSHSKLPLRLATIAGFIMSTICLLVAIFYFAYKLLYWNRFNVGVAPLIIGGFFFASCLMFFIGVIGEYVGAIHTLVMKRPLVVEKERINFESDE